jgi:hypothetical protein
MSIMRRIVLAVLGLGLFASLGGPADAADYYPYRRSAPAWWNVWYGDNCCKAGTYGPGIRVAEQVPYCGDCDDPIGLGSSDKVRLRYVGDPIWERGCALGGCYGYYGVRGSCYGREVRLADGYGGWVWGIAKFCD